MRWVRKYIQCHGNTNISYVGYAITFWVFLIILSVGIFSGNARSDVLSFYVLITVPRTPSHPTSSLKNLSGLFKPRGSFPSSEVSLQNRITHSSQSTVCPSWFARGLSSLSFLPVTFILTSHPRFCPFSSTHSGISNVILLSVHPVCSFKEMYIH